jgi:hypothetical protein
LTLIGALDRKAATLARRDNVNYVLEEMQRRGRAWIDYRTVQRRIGEARTQFRHTTLFLDGRAYGHPAALSRSSTSR